METITHNITLQHCQLHTHQSTVLTYNPQKKCAGNHHYIMDHNSPSAIQSHGRQGQPATQSHRSRALIITLGPLQRESGSPGPEIVARKRLYGLKAFVIQSLFKPVFSCRGEKSTAVACQGRCVCLSMHVKGLTHTKYRTVCAKSVCGKRGPMTHESLINSHKNKGLSSTGVNHLMWD